MTDAIDLTTEQRKTLITLLRRFLPGVTVWAYGSRVKWTARPNSDLDLVAFATPAQRPQVVELKEALAESNLPFPVDLHVWDEVPERFREIIRKEYVVVQEAKETTQKQGVADKWRETPYGPFAADFAACRLVDLCHPEAGIQTGPFGSQLHQEDYVKVGTPIITVEHLGENRILHREVPRVGDSDRNRLSRYLLRQGDIVFSRVGSVDRRALVRSEEDGWMFSGRCLRVRPDPAKIDSGYLAYFFGLPSFKEHVRAIAVGATMPSLNTSLLGELVIPYTKNISEQRAIAYILDTLDDKIDLNRRMNETLEAMARALFKSWFSCLDTVRVEAAELIRQGVLEIGDGYRAKNSELGDQGLPFIRAGNLNNGFDTEGAEVLRHDSVAKTGSKVSRPGDVAFTSKGTIGRFARVTQFTQPFVYSPQVCFWRSLNHKQIQPALLYCWMQSGDLKAQIDAVAGQTDMAPYVSLQDQRKMRVPVFPDDQDVVAGHIDAILARQALCIEESKTLAAIRDALLPKLISGELRVPEGAIKLGDRA